MTLSQISGTKSRDDAKRLGLPNLAFVGKPGAGKHAAANFVRKYSDQILIGPKMRDPVLQTLRGENFVIVEIVAPDHLRHDRLTAAGRYIFKRHTEPPSDFEPDYLIENDGTLANLHDALLIIIDRERRKR